MSKQRILIFSTAYLPFIGGAEVAVKEITDRLGSVFDFEMVTARLDSKLPVTQRLTHNFVVHRIGVGNRLDKLRLYFEGVKQARTLGKFNVVWAVMASYAGFAALRYKKQNPAARFLLTLQEGDSKWHIYKRVWWCWWYFKQIFKRADHIQAISTYLAAWAKQLGATCPITVVPNGVDVKSFILSVEDKRVRYRESLRDELCLPKNAPVIFSASRLVPKNGIGDLIGSLLFLPATVHLVLAGDGALRGSLGVLARQSNVAARVHFLGHQDPDNLPALLWGSDVFCRPSLSEGLGNSFLEALAAGVPVVATPVGGIPDFLQDGQTGLFCAVNNPKDIAEKIKIILSGDALRGLLFENGKKLISQKYSWETVAAQMKQILV